MSPSSDSEEAAVLRGLRADLARLYHDLSNPLAIVSGNLQLLREVGVAEDASSFLMESVGDAIAAVDQFEAPMAQFARLRELLEARLKALDGTGE